MIIGSKDYNVLQMLFELKQLQSWYKSSADSDSRKCNSNHSNYVSKQISLILIFPKQTVRSGESRQPIQMQTLFIVIDLSTSIYTRLYQITKRVI